MLAALETIFYLLMFFMVGFLFCRTKLISSSQSKLLSTIVVYAFLPCTVIRSFTKNFTLDNLSTYLTLVLVATAILFVNILLSGVFARIFAKEPYPRNVYRYSTVVPNGNLGYGFAEGMMGTEGLLTFSIFNIPACIYCYTFGYGLLTGKKMSLKRLLNPVTIAVVVGIILGLLPIQIPEILQTLLDKAAACTIPLCMVIVGIVISDFKILDLFRNWKAWVFCLIRMILFPLLLRFLLPLFLGPEIVRIAVLFYALPCGMNSVLLSRLINEDCRTGAELVLISNLISIVSIPLITMGLV